MSDARQVNALFTKKYYKNNRVYSRYEGKDVTVALYEGKYSNTSGGKCKYYAAHVVLKNYNKMHIAKANGERSNGFQTVYQMVHDKKNKAYNSILAVNGAFNGADSDKWDAFGGGKYYYTSNHDYYEICGGKYYKGTLGGDRVNGGATYSSKTGLLTTGLKQKGVVSGMTFQEASAKKLILDTFHGDMGFTLLLNKEIIGSKNDKWYRPRTFIGTNGKPGNFWIVVCNGDMADGYSKGLNAYGEGHILKKLKCTYGYNLDGGGSSTMVFRGKTVNKQVQLRKCYDALYVKR